MPDREKIIKAIETHISTDDSVGCDDCTYYNNDWCITRVLTDVLALLKEQETKETMVAESTNMYTGLPIAHCPKCEVSLDRFLYGRQYEGQINYCPFCGQAIKWE